MVGFFEFSLMRAKDSIPKKRMAEALHAYTHGDEAFHREVFGGDTTIGRALVHEPARADGDLPVDQRRRGLRAPPKMAPGGSPRPVPQHGIERMVRMAVERGRLADLLFDQGGGLGSRFLHRAIATLTALPPASRLLATEQVKSRFVRALLSAPRA